MTRTHAYIACLFVVFFYSGNILVGSALNELPPITVAFFRVLIAAVALLPLGWQSAWRYRSAFRRHLGPLLLLTITGVTFFNTFIYTALQFTSATNVSVLEAVIPVATALLSAWLLRERLRLVQWTGVLVSFIGALWVVMGSVTDHLFGGWNVGDLVMVGAIVSWALYSIAVKRYIHLFPEYGTLLVMTSLSVGLLAPLVAMEWTVMGVPEFGYWAHWAGLAYLGIFPSVIALLLYNRAVRVLGASQASVFLNFLPVVTMIGATLFLSETIAAAQIAGASLVIAGVLLTTRVARKRP
ncbi:DMT family transporter [Nesterenkonia natronophila]|uniref:DMT family transporter n=1 Tax=Nesterenkonia natronophila TaxID=2174932 RepID=A0A3A4F4K9_9MICC|nr:DMT family transporter [Nesterenkonia natronophila]RJN32661.1 DMT family transporter [Nesterenkonia natronophila]